MPIMPRANKKAQKIAFNILGTPANLRKQNQSSKKSKIIDDYQEPKTNGKYEELSRIMNK